MVTNKCFNHNHSHITDQSNVGVSIVTVHVIIRIIDHCPLIKEEKKHLMLILLRLWQSSSVLSNCQSASGVYELVGQEDHCKGEVNNKSLLLRASVR